jgi:hypothetical protein
MELQNVAFVLFVLFIALGAVATGAVVTAKVSGKPTNKLELLRKYAKLAVEAAEQIGKMRDMSGPEKKMYARKVLAQLAPDMPDWMADALIEAQVYLLDTTIDWFADKVEEEPV